MKKLFGFIYVAFRHFGAEFRPLFLLFGAFVFAPVVAFATCPTGYTSSNSRQLAASSCSTGYTTDGAFGFVDGNCPAGWTMTELWLPDSAAEFSDAKGMYGYSCSVQ